MTRIQSRMMALLVAVGMIVGGAPAASGQTASALFREGQPLPGAPAGHVVNSINNPATNHVGGFAAAVNTSDGVTTLSHVWGNASGGPGTVMRTEGTFGPYTQTSFESFYGISDAGRVAYSATYTGGLGSDSVWLDDTPVAVEGNAHPTMAGQFWSFGSRPGVTAGGTPYFVGGITSTAGGSTQNRGLFYGNDGGTTVLLGGQTPANLPRALTMTGSPVGFDYRMSANGSNYIVPAQMVSPTADDACVVMNGSGLVLGGNLVQETRPVPAGSGGQAGENWANFDFMGINNAGDYFFTGDTNLASSADEFIFKNGQMLYRDGMNIDGVILQGDIEAAYMNEAGNIAYIWDVDANVTEALFLDDQVLLKEGDNVDLNGDGIPEPTSSLVNFTGIASLAISEPTLGGVIDVYFAADIDVNGTPSTSDDIEGFFRIRVPEPGSLALLTIGALALIGRRRK